MLNVAYGHWHLHRFQGDDVRIQYLFRKSGNGVLVNFLRQFTSIAGHWMAGYSLAGECEQVTFGYAQPSLPVPSRKCVSYIDAKLLA